jgi:ATP-binding protein involved in chromosome partitioning
MFERVSVPVAGIVENMSAWTDPATGQRLEMFGSGGGARLAEELQVPLLGSVPLQPGLAERADRGQPIVASEPDSPAARAILTITEAVIEAAGARSISLPILRG